MADKSIGIDEVAALLKSEIRGIATAGKEAGGDFAEEFMEAAVDGVKRRSKELKSEIAKVFDDFNRKTNNFKSRKTISNAEWSNVLSLSKELMKSERYVDSIREKLSNITVSFRGTGKISGIDKILDEFEKGSAIESVLWSEAGKNYKKKKAAIRQPKVEAPVVDADPVHEIKEEAKQIDGLEQRYRALIQAVQEWKKLAADVKSISAKNSQDLRKQVVGLVSQISADTAHMIGPIFEANFANGFKGIKTKDILASIMQLDNADLLGHITEQLNVLENIDLKNFNLSEVLKLDSSTSGHFIELYDVLKKIAQIQGQVDSPVHKATDAIEAQGEAIDKVVKKMPKIESVIKRYNKLMSDLCVDHLTIGTRLSQDTDGWGIKEMVKEAKNQLADFYNPGHDSYIKADDLTDDVRKRMQSDIGKLKRFIASYEQYVDMTENITPAAQSVTQATEKQTDALLKQEKAAERATKAQTELNDAQNKVSISSYQDLYDALKKVVELSKQLKPEHTAEFGNMHELMDKAGYHDSKESLVADIKAQYGNVHRIKASIKNGLSVYKDIDGDGYEVTRSIDSNTLKDAEDMLNAYVYQAVEYFGYTITDAMEDFDKKRVRAFVEKTIDQHMSVSGKDDAYSADAEVFNAPIKDVIDSITSTILNMATDTKNMEYVLDHLSGLKSRAKDVTRYTLSASANMVGSKIGISTPYDETQLNAKKIESYEDLCEVVARYNELQKGAIVFGGNDYPGLDEAEEMERKRLMARLEATGGKDIYKLSGFDGFSDIDKLASVLGIEIPKAIDRAEGAQAEFTQETEDAASAQNKLKNSVKDTADVLYHAGDLSNISGTLKSFPLGNVPPTKTNGIGGLTGLYTTDELDGFIGNEWQGAPISTIDPSVYKLLNARSNEIAEKFGGFLSDLNATIYGYYEVIDEKDWELKQDANVKSVDELYKAHCELFKDSALTMEQFTQFIKNAREKIAGKSFTDIEQPAIDEGIAKSGITRAIQDVADDVFQSDSFKTQFLKMLGYEGVDLRGTKYNGTYSGGSVIFDVKPESIKATNEKWSDVMARNGYEVTEDDLKYEEKRRQLAFETAKAYSKQADAAKEAVDGTGATNAVNNELKDTFDIIQHGESVTARFVTTAKTVREALLNMRNALPQDQKEWSSYIDQLLKAYDDTYSMDNKVAEIGSMGDSSEQYRIENLGGGRMSIAFDGLVQQIDEATRIQKEREGQLEAYTEAAVSLLNSGYESVSSSDQQNLFTEFANKIAQDGMSASDAMDQLYMSLEKLRAETVKMPESAVGDWAPDVQKLEDHVNNLGEEFKSSVNYRDNFDTLVDGIKSGSITAAQAIEKMSDAYEAFSIDAMTSLDKSFEDVLSNLPKLTSNEISNVFNNVDLSGFLSGLGIDESNFADFRVLFEDLMRITKAMNDGADVGAVFNSQIERIIDSIVRLGGYEVDFSDVGLEDEMQEFQKYMSNKIVRYNDIIKADYTKDDWKTLFGAKGRFKSKITKDATKGMAPDELWEEIIDEFPSLFGEYREEGRPQEQWKLIFSKLGDVIDLSRSGWKVGQGFSESDRGLITSSAATLYNEMASKLFASESTDSMSDEAKAARDVAQSMNDAAKAKEKFDNANKNVKKGADASSQSLNDEAESMERVATAKAPDSEDWDTVTQYKVGDNDDPSVIRRSKTVRTDDSERRITENLSVNEDGEWETVGSSQTDNYRRVREEELNALYKDRANCLTNIAKYTKEINDADTEAGRNAAREVLALEQDRLVTINDMIDAYGDLVNQNKLDAQDDDLVAKTRNYEQQRYIDLTEDERAEAVNAALQRRQSILNNIAKLEKQRNGASSDQEKDAINAIIATEQERARIVSREIDLYESVNAAQKVQQQDAKIIEKSRQQQQQQAIADAKTVAKEQKKSQDEQYSNIKSTYDEYLKAHKNIQKFNLDLSGKDHADSMVNEQEKLSQAQEKLLAMGVDVGKIAESGALTLEQKNELLEKELKHRQEIHDLVVKTSDKERDMQKAEVTKSYKKSYNDESKALANIDTLTRALGEDGAGVNLQAKIASYKALVQEMNNLNQQLDNDLSLADDEKFTNHYADVASKAKGARKEIEEIFKSSQKLKKIGTLVAVGDQDVGKLQDAKSAMMSFVDSSFDGEVAIKGFNKAGTEMYATVKESTGELKNITVALDGASGRLNAFETGTSKATNEWKEFKSQVSGGIQRAAGMYLGLNDLIRYGREGLNYVKEIDLAMTELKKVTDETNASYKEFLSDAGSTSAVIGSTISDFTEATATFARLGYSLEESSSMAETAIIYKNVAD